MSTRKRYYVARLYTSEKKMYLGYGLDRDSAKTAALEFAKGQEPTLNSFDKFEKVTVDPAIGALPQSLRTNGQST